MKIASLVSGILIIALLIMFFTGVINFNNNIVDSLVKGNQAYAASNYDKALEAYKKGLGENSEDPKLNYNSGQASYRLNKFEDAVKYYVKTSDTPDKYINSGNSSLKLADSIDDAAQKQQYYQQALETYKQGILAFPENIPLKYNYEYVKSKLGDQQNNKDNQNQNDQNNQSNQDQQNQDKNGQNDQNKQDQQNQDKNGQDNQNKQDENSGQNKESEQDKQNENSGQQDNKEQNKENQQSSQTGQDEEQNNAQSGDKKEEKVNQKNASQAQESDSPNSEQEDSNIAQVLRMLERQEEDSLKNNQEIKSKAKGDEYDW